MKPEGRKLSKFSAYKKDCQSIFKLWAEGKGDLEIRTQLKLSQEAFENRLEFMREHKVLVASIPVLFERLLVSQLHVKRKALAAYEDNKDYEKTVSSAARFLQLASDCDKNILEFAFRLGIIKEQPKKIEFVREEFQNMSTEEIALKYKAAIMGPA